MKSIFDIFKRLSVVKNYPRPENVPLSPQKFLVLIWCTSEGWKDETTLEGSHDFEPETLDWESSALTTRQLLHNRSAKINLDNFISFSLRNACYPKLCHDDQGRQIFENPPLSTPWRSMFCRFLILLLSIWY